MTTYSNIFKTISGFYRFNKTSEQKTEFLNDKGELEVNTQLVTTSHAVGASEYNTENENALLAEIEAYTLTHPDEVEYEQAYVPTLTEVKANKMAELNATYEVYATQAKADTPESEVLTWDIQKTECEAWYADNSAPTPFIDKLALGRGIDRLVMIEKIYAKLVQYREFTGVLTGILQGYKDMLEVATTVEEVEAIAFVIPNTFSL